MGQGNSGVLLRLGAVIELQGQRLRTRGMAVDGGDNMLGLPPLQNRDSTSVDALDSTQADDSANYTTLAKYVGK